MRNRFDHLAKRIARKALAPSGTTVAHDEISPETQHADLRHEPDPTRKAERDRLGLLGRISDVLCLIEAYSHAPSADEFRACLAKHIAFWRQRGRLARADNKRRGKRQPREAVVEPFLWIIASRTPTAILTKLELKPARDWPAGVYFFGDDVLRVGIVEPILLELQHLLGKQPSRTPEEQKFMVTMHRPWEDARIEGRTESRAEAVLTALRVRGISVPAAARKRILAEKDLQRLKRWLEKAVVATSIEEVIDDQPVARSSRTGRPAAHKERNGRKPHRAAAHR